MSSWKLLLLLLTVYNAHAVDPCPPNECDSNDESRYPSAEELKDLADAVMTKIADVNNDNHLKFDADQDTIAVGLCNGGLLVAGNVKERRRPADGEEFVKIRPTKKMSDGTRPKQKVKYVNYGLTEILSKVAIEEIMSRSIFKRNPMDITVIEEKINPINDPNLKMIEKANRHAEKHAEIKMQAYCAGTGQRLQRIGISKEPCERCHGLLGPEGIGVEMSPNVTGTKKVTHHVAVDMEDVEIRDIYCTPRCISAGSTEAPDARDLPFTSGHGWARFRKIVGRGRHFRG